MKYSVVARFLFFPPFVFYLAGRPHPFSSLLRRRTKTIISLKRAALFDNEKIVISLFLAPRKARRYPPSFSPRAEISFLFLLILCCFSFGVAQIGLYIFAFSPFFPSPSGPVTSTLSFLSFLQGIEAFFRCS